MRWRDRIVGDRRFQRWAARFPLTRPIARRHTRALFDLCAGFVYSQVLYACVQLELFERLAERPRSIVEIAAATGMDERSARALTDAAVALGLLARVRRGRVALGRLGAALRGNPGIAAMIGHHAMLYADLQDPGAMLRRPGGESRLAAYWGYAGRADAAALSPAQVGGYTALMAASQPMLADEVLAAYDFSRHFCLLDVGGGDGSFLQAVGRQAPGLTLMLFDLPAVAQAAEAKLSAAGLAGRARCIGGSFAAAALPVGADIVSFVRVLHDHEDAVVRRLLGAARAALPHGGTVLIAEPLADTPSAAAYFSFYLRTMGSGRPRTAATLKAMLREAGFEAPRLLGTPTPLLAQVVVAECKSQLTEAIVSLG